MTTSVDQHAPGEGDFSCNGVTANEFTSGPVSGRIGIVVARFNTAITDALFDGAVRTLQLAGVSVDQIDAVQVPGAVELPFAAREFARSGHHAAVVALGCVIRGDTAHFDYVCQAATDGCQRVSLEYGVPVGFGVITCDTLEQALARSTSDGANVGSDAASAALEMARLANA